MKFHATQLIPPLLGLFLFASGASVKAAEPIYVGSDASSQITSIVDNGAGNFTVNYNPIDGCTEGSGYGTSKIEFAFWNGSSWEHLSDSTSGCNDNNFHSTSFIIDLTTYAKGAGTYILNFQNSSNTTIKYIALDWNGTNVPTPITITLDTTTRIISFTPEDATTTQNPVFFSLHAYINAEDVGSYINVNLTLHNIDQNVFLVSDLSPSDVYFLDQVEATSSGDFYYASSTILGEGNYRINVQLTRTYLGGWFRNPWASVSDEQSHTFVVGQPTFIGAISQGSWKQANAIFASSTATSTENLAKTCRPFSGEFDTLKCLAFLFVPDAGYLTRSLNTFKNDAATRFPLGYVTDLIGILSTSTASSLPIIDAEVPPGIPGQGASITLSLDHSLDYILNATTSRFANVSASSSQTFYQITNYYWSLIVYLLTAFYLIGRIMGSHLIPRVGHTAVKISRKKL